MLLSRPLTILTGILSLGLSVYADSKDNLQRKLKDATVLASANNDRARSISLANAFSTVPELLSANGNIGQTLSTGSATLMSRDLVITIEVNGPSARQKHFDSLEYHSTGTEESLLDGFRDFVQMMKQMLASETAKKGIIEIVGWRYQLATSLSALEGACDYVAFDVLGELSKYKKQGQEAADELRTAIDEAVKAFE